MSELQQSHEDKLRRKRLLQQQKWRQKQEKIYYTEGRPIFNTLRVCNYYFYNHDNGKKIGTLCW
jgi:hypothetical protein